jgi:sarcosine oxidase
MPSYDVIIAGLGTVGAATIMNLARRGISVLGLDAYRPPHKKASHHGESRSIRRAYLEGSVYVPMACRAWELWRKLEKDTGANLLTPTGNLTIGPGDAPAVAGFLQSARHYDIPHEELTAAEVRRRWPLLTLPDGAVAALEVEAGVIKPERALRVMLAEAEKAGAVLHFDEPLQYWRDSSHGVPVRSSRGTYEAGRLLLSTGAYTRSLLGNPAHWLMPKRVAVHWVAPTEPRSFGLGCLPVNFWQLPAGDFEETGTYREFYSLPITRDGGRVKAAAHNNLADCDPLHMNPAATPSERAVIHGFLENHIPSLAGCDIHSEVCLYTLTPDGDFVLGPLPGHADIMTAALAGHGFKFAPVLGEILADMLEDRTPAFDVARFSARRFA